MGFCITVLEEVPPGSSKCCLLEFGSPQAPGLASKPTGIYWYGWPGLSSFSTQASLSDLNQIEITTGSQRSYNSLKAEQIGCGLGKPKQSKITTVGHDGLLVQNCSPNASSAPGLCWVLSEEDRGGFVPSRVYYLANR